MHSPISQQRDRKSHDSPPKNSPIADTPLPFFFGAIHSVLHFSDGVLNTQTWCASSDFSNKHSLLQITPSNSSAIQFSCSLAHLRHLAARSGVNFSRCFASHFIPFFWRYRSIVASDTSGAHSSRGCSRVSFQLCLIVRQICRRSHW